MSKSKKDLVEQIMRLEHNNNVLNNTINQQTKNFKAIQRDNLKQMQVEIEDKVGN